MSEAVVDTNVWVYADRITADGAGIPAIEGDCIESCYLWLTEFVDGSDQLVVDYSNRIIGEYRQNIVAGGVAEQLLNQLEIIALERIIYVDIDFDRNHHAELPFALGDPSDRKFVAAAIAREPFAPIYNATDTDWSKEREALSRYGLTINELCPDYIQQRLSAS